MWPFCRNIRDSVKVIFSTITTRVCIILFVKLIYILYIRKTYDLYERVGHVFHTTTVLLFCAVAASSVIVYLTVTIGNRGVNTMKSWNFKTFLPLGCLELVCYFLFLSYVWMCFIFLNFITTFCFAYAIFVVFACLQELRNYRRLAVLVLQSCYSA